MIDLLLPDAGFPVDAGVRDYKLILHQNMDIAAMQEAHRPSADIVRIPVDPLARLRSALRMLTTRLAEQGEVMSGWREDAESLSRATRELGDSLKSCQQNLDALDAKVARARVAARELEHTANRLLAASVSG